MKKYIFLVVLILSLSFHHSVYAASDLVITCGTSTCAKSSDTSLFTSATVWYPGLSEEHTIHVDNTVNAVRDISTNPELFEQMENGLDTVLILEIFRIGTPTALWKGTLTEFFTYSDTHPLALTQVGANSSIDLIYKVTMDRNAGNEFQNTNTMFDLSFNFSGEDPQPTPTPSGSSSSDSTGSSGSSSTSTGGSTPTGATGPTGETGFRSSFLSNEESDITGPTGQTMGTNTDEANKPAVEGASTVLCQVCIWWPLLVLEAIITVLYYSISKLRKGKHFWIGGLAISITTYVIFLFLNRSCRNGWELWLSTTSFWCKYFIIWVLLIFSGISFIFRPLKEQEDYLVTPEKK
jgi:hypothetical protein